MIRIRLAILDRDENYLSRISSVFNNKLADKVELYTFTDMNIAMEVITSKRIDVLIAEEVFDIDVTNLPEGCAFAYLTQAKEIDSYKGERIIAKFQKVDLIYKEALSLFSEKATKITGVKFENSDTETITFFSCSGGVGGSTMAAACATNLS
ncbi:MAG: chromosome partitioning protein ParA, partial [Clostridiales bacterium]|nr:chromosome partitioning protein ParA [Clostridiales bacterium]